jgi:hypothetical protein
VLVPQPGDSVSEVVQSLSHQRGKIQKTKHKKQTKKQKTKQNKNPKFKCNTVLVSPSASSSSSVIVSSKKEKKRKKKRVWRQLCECLSEAAATCPLLSACC